MITSLSPVPMIHLKSGSRSFLEYYSLDPRNILQSRYYIHNYERRQFNRTSVMWHLLLKWLHFSQHSNLRRKFRIRAQDHVRMSFVSFAKCISFQNNLIIVCWRRVNKPSFNRTMLIEPMAVKVASGLFPAKFSYQRHTLSQILWSCNMQPTHRGQLFRVIQFN